MGQLAAKENRAKRRRAQSFETLVQAGLAVIAKRGIYETTVEHITEAADIGKGTFYAHFPSKDDLVHHLVRHGLDELIAAGRGVTTDDPTPADRLAALMRSQLRVLARRRDLVILLHQLRGLLIRQPRGRQHLRQEYQRYIRFLMDECRHALGRPNLPAGEARDLACAIAGFVAGMLSFELLVRNGGGARASFDGPVNAFAAGAAAHYGAPGAPANGSACG